jgi:Ca-activated chloride channel family protein
VAQFEGRPALKGGQAVLIEQTMRQSATLSQIALELSVKPAQLDRALTLWVYVEDLAMPRARIRLADLVRLGGRRPLNLAVRAGAVVRIVLVDPKGIWAASAPHIAIRVTA